MKINKSIYEGYIWWSDKSTPDLYLNEEFGINLDETENPFIVEGQLFDGTISYSIKYIDGKYIVNEFDIRKLAQFESTPKSYVSNRMGSETYLQFNQYWRPVPDPLCENMSTLQPAELVFTGFKKGKE